MKLKLFIFSISFLFTQELKVEGNLNVTGAVINDSLNQIIFYQQTEIDSLQTLVLQLQNSNTNQQSLNTSLQNLIAQLQAQIASLEAQMSYLGQDLGNADCFGVVGGDAVLDICGICGGDGIPEGYCNCTGDSVLDICGICGGDATNEEDCSPFEMITVHAGDYTYGEDDQILTIDYDYEIMKYEVTNAEYLAYLENALLIGEIIIDGNYIQGYFSGDEHFDPGLKNFYILGTESPWYNLGQISYNGNGFIINVPPGYNEGDFDNHPVGNVTWFGANAFAEHYNMSLPTKYEWEKAARGNTGYDYPWGNSINGNHANFSNSGDPWDNGTTPVGYYNGDNNTVNSPSPYGLYDMSGNVWEWTDSYYTWGTNHIGKGGSFQDNHDESYFNSWGYGSLQTFNSGPNTGFRLIRAL